MEHCIKKVLFVKIRINDDENGSFIGEKKSAGETQKEGVLALFYFVHTFFIMQAHLIEKA